MTNTIGRKTTLNTTFTVWWSALKILIVILTTFIPYLPACTRWQILYSQLVLSVIWCTISKQNRDALKNKPTHALHTKQCIQIGYCSNVRFMFYPGLESRLKQNKPKIHLTCICTVIVWAQWQLIPHIFSKFSQNCQSSEMMWAI